MPARMVTRVRKAAPRKFSVQKMLRKNKFVYNVRKAPKEVVERAVDETDAVFERGLGGF